MSRGEGAILGKFRGILRGFNSFVALSPGSSPTACAPTPLAHSVGEGLGVRAKKRARPAHSEPKRCTLISHTPTVRYNPDW